MDLERQMRTLMMLKHEHTLIFYDWGIYLNLTFVWKGVSILSGKGHAPGESCVFDIYIESTTRTTKKKKKKKKKKNRLVPLLGT